MAIVVTDLGSAGGSGNQSLTVTIPAGAAVVVGTADDGTTTTGAAVGDGTNTYNKVDSAFNNASTASSFGATWLCNSATAVTGATLQYTEVGTHSCISAFYATGLSATPLDVHTTATGASTNAKVTSSAPNQANSLWAGMVTWKGSATFTQTSGYATPFSSATSGGTGVPANIGGGNLVASDSLAKTYGANSDLSTSRSWAAFIMALKPATGETGTGNLAFGGLAISGAGERKETGTGNLAFGALAISGSGTREEPGSGVLAFSGIALDGEGTIPVSGNLGFSGLDLAGSGSAFPIGDGTLGFDGLDLSGAATRAETGASALAFDGLGISGAGTHGKTGVGSLAFGGIALAAAAFITATGSGALAFDGFGIRGIVSDEFGDVSLAFGSFGISASGQNLGPAGGGGATSDITPNFGLPLWAPAVRSQLQRVRYNDAMGIIDANLGGASGGGADPTATASDVAVLGTATTFMRSDAAPAIQLASADQFGLVKVDGTTITASGGVISSVGGGSGGSGGLVPSVLSATTADQPVSPSAGDVYIVPQAGWSGAHGNTEARYDGSIWTYTALLAASTYAAQDTGAVYVWTGAALQPLYVSLARASSLTAAFTAADALSVPLDIDIDGAIATGVNQNWPNVILRGRGGTVGLTGTATLTVLDIDSPQQAVFDTTASTIDAPVTLARNPVNGVRSHWFSGFVSDGATDIGAVWKHWVNTRAGADYTAYNVKASPQGTKHHATETLFFPEEANSTRQGLTLLMMGAVFDYRVALSGSKGVFFGGVVDGSPVSGFEIGSVGKCLVTNLLAQNCAGDGFTFGYVDGVGPTDGCGMDNALFIQCHSLSNLRGFHGITAASPNVPFTTNTFIQCQANQNQKEGWKFEGKNANYNAWWSCDAEGDNTSGTVNSDNTGTFYNDGFQSLIVGGQMTDHGGANYTLKLTGSNNIEIGTRLGGAIYKSDSANTFILCAPFQFDGGTTNSNNLIFASAYGMSLRAQNTTLASHAFSASYGSFFIVDTQGGAATDDCTAINDIVQGQEVTVTIKTASRKVTLKNGIGNLHLVGGADYQLTTTRSFVKFFSPDGVNLYELGRA